MIFSLVLLVAAGASAQTCRPRDEAIAAYAEARAAADIIETGTIRDLALQSIGQGLVELGEFTDASQLAGAIGAANYRAALLVELGEKQALAGERDSALGSFRAAMVAADEVGAVGLRGPLLQELAESMAAAGEIELAKRISQAIDTRLNRAGAERAIAAALANRGDLVGARAMIENASVIVEDIGNPMTRPEALAEIALAWANAGDLASAVATAQRIDWPQGRAASLVAIAEITARAGGRADVAAFVEEIEDGSDRSVGFQRLAAVAVAKANIAEAEMLLGRAQAALDDMETDEDPARQVRVRADLSVAYFRAGHATTGRATLDHAIRQAREMEDGYPRARALTDLAKAAARHEAFQLARDLATEHQWPALQADALIAIARTAVDLGASDKSATLLSQALRVASEIADPKNRAWSMRAVSEAWLAAGEIERALTVARDIAELDHQAITIATMNTAGRSTAPEALAVARNVEQKRARVWTLIGVAGALTKSAALCE